DHSRWGVVESFASGLSRSQPRFESGYEQGSSAGTLTLSANDPSWYVQQVNQHPELPKPQAPSATGAIRILEGDVAAATVVGPKQRELPTGSTDPTQVWRQQPGGATLEVDRAGDVSIASVGPQLPADFGPRSAADPARRYQDVLPARWFNGSTFKVVTITAGYDANEAPQAIPPDPGTVNRAPGGHLTLGPGVVLDLGDGGPVNLTGRGADIEGARGAPGGKVSLQTLQTGGDPDRATSTHIGAAGVVDVAGRWTDGRQAGAARALDGGSVSITAANIVLENGSLIDVSGGGRPRPRGKKLTPRGRAADPLRRRHQPP